MSESSKKLGNLALALVNLFNMVRERMVVAAGVNTFDSILTEEVEESMETIGKIVAEGSSYLESTGQYSGLMQAYQYVGQLNYRLWHAASKLIRSAQADLPLRVAACASFPVSGPELVRALRAFEKASEGHDFLLWLKSYGELTDLLRKVENQMSDPKTRVAAITKPAPVKRKVGKPRRYVPKGAPRGNTGKKGEDSKKGKKRAPSSRKKVAAVA